MDHKQQGQLVGYAVGGLIFLVIFGFRIRRMMQSRPFNVQNVWIMPAIFVALTALALWGRPPQGREWLWVAGSFVIGAALGWFRAKTIRLTLHPETRQVMAQGSPLAMLFILAIFVLRFALRGVLAAESSVLGISVAVVDSVFLAMACGLFLARAVEMGIRATQLLNRGSEAARPSEAGLTLGCESGMSVRKGKTTPMPIRPSIRRLSIAAAACAALVSQASAQPATAPEPAAAPIPAVGMVDQPCAAGSFGRSDLELAFAEAIVADRPMDPQVLKAYVQGAAERAKADQARVANDWADLCRYRLADDAAAKAGGTKVVFLGDSITELWQVADPALFTGGVIDRGVSGQTSGQNLLRFYQNVVALHPKAVQILTGTNDIAGNSGPIRPEDFKNNIRAMVDIAKANHIRVILASITPAGRIPWRSGIKPAPQIDALNAWLADYAKVQGLVYADYHAVLTTPDGAMKAGISRDGVHPTRAGYALMAPVAKAAIAKALAQP